MQPHRPLPLPRWWVQMAQTTRQGAQAASPAPAVQVRVAQPAVPSPGLYVTGMSRAALPQTTLSQQRAYVSNESEAVMGASSWAAPLEQILGREHCMHALSRLQHTYGLRWGPTQ